MSPRPRGSAASSAGLRIVSGGQTGVDRAALDFAIAHGLEHGGWAPRYRTAEDGPLPPRYRLRETPSTNYAQRTAWNVRDADATVVFSHTREVSGGTRLTLEMARRLGRPLLHLWSGAEPGPQRTAACALALRGFLGAYAVRTLNVAGPRASQGAGLEGFVHEVLGAAVAPSGPPTPAASDL